MCGHILAHGFDAIAYDVDAGRLSAAAATGAQPASGLSELAGAADIILACLRTDEQMEAVTEQLVTHGRAGQPIVATATHGLESMWRLATTAEPSGMRVSMRRWSSACRGAKEGNLLLLCSGDPVDVERARPVLLSYSRDVEHVGAREFRGARHCQAVRRGCPAHA